MLFQITGNKWNAAKWETCKTNADFMKCSNCIQVFTVKEIEGFNFCPVCGSWMGSDEEWAEFVKNHPKRFKGV